MRALVVTTAQPRYFCTGIDIPWLMTEAAAGPDRIRAFLEAFHGALLELTGFPKPVVAAVRGHAIGGGAILAAACDYRLMNAERGFVQLPAVHLGLPFSPGMVALFESVLPAGAFRRMAYSGDRFTSAEAHALGFVDELHAPDVLPARAVELAAKLGTSRTATFAAIKRGLRRHVLHVMRTEDPPRLAETVAGHLPG